MVQSTCSLNPFASVFVPRSSDAFQSSEDAEGVCTVAAEAAQSQEAAPSGPHLAELLPDEVSPAVDGRAA